MSFWSVVEVLLKDFSLSREICQLCQTFQDCGEEISSGMASVEEQHWIDSLFIAFAFTLGPVTPLSRMQSCPHGRSLESLAILPKPQRPTWLCYSIYKRVGSVWIDLLPFLVGSNLQVSRGFYFLSEHQYLDQFGTTRTAGLSCKVTYDLVMMTSSNPYHLQKASLLNTIV